CWATGHPLTTPVALGSLLLVAFVARIPALARRRRRGPDTGAGDPPAPDPSRCPRGLKVSIEGLFLLGMLLFVFLARRNPAVDPDSERFMDYAFLRACLRSQGL